MQKNFKKEYLYISFFFSLSVIIACAETSQPKNPYLKEFPESGELKIQFSDFTEHEWPMTNVATDC